MFETLLKPWPWYVSGPLIGLMVPGLLFLGGRTFGISSSFKHICAAALPGRFDFFQYDWKRIGLWNLMFVLGVGIGGFLGANFLTAPDAAVAISDVTRSELQALGIQDFSGLAPREIFSWEGLFSWPGLLMIVGGGFLVGFGARYAGGCTSGHAISGLANMQLPSLLAVIGFFVGGMIVTYLFLPLVM